MCKESQKFLINLTLKQINLGETLIKSIDAFDDIEGYQKLCRKINQEIKFLQKVYKSKAIKKEYLQCSNLTHFSALINHLKTLQNCLSINKVFLLEGRKINVDIVSDSGLTWTKVIARNPKSVSQICMGNASYGVRSIIDQAEEFVQCANLYPCLFQIPKVVFVFANGITNSIAIKLESYGIIVQGSRLDDFTDDIETNLDKGEDKVKDINGCEVADLTTKNISNINIVNLDVSAMLAYCSSVTNGGADKYDFDVTVLKQQAQWERLRPQVPLLDKFFEGKNLYCCQTARDSFINIVKTVGGPNEKIRAEAFLKRIIVLPDNADSRGVSEIEKFKEIFSKVQFTKDKSLKIGGKIRQRSLTIFSFGDRIRAVTVSANDGFIRAAKQQGVSFVVFVHESRALTEQKEKTKAIPILK